MIFILKSESKSSESCKLRYIHDSKVAYGLCAIWSLNCLKYLLLAFVTHARWTGDIYNPHIKLSDCSYVRISSITKQLMSLYLFRCNLHELSFALSSAAEEVQHYH